MSVPETIRILIVDDHPVVRDGLSALINCQPDMKVVAEAGDGGEAVEQFAQYRPDVALIDLRMREMDGLQAILTIRQRFPGAQLVVLTTFDDNEDIYRALQGGAKGYVLKGAPREELLECIRTVSAGKSHIAPEVAAKLAERLSQPGLSERELEVLTLVADGRSNQEIGSLLHIGEGTVKVHVNHILDKMGVNNRTAAGVAALERGLIRSR
ncbi:MAG: response regulator transcription factor [Terriglobia bacterium]|jgi:two-component system NarL family response regulator